MSATGFCCLGAPLEMHNPKIGVRHMKKRFPRTGCSQQRVLNLRILQFKR